MATPLCQPSSRRHSRARTAVRWLGMAFVAMALLCSCSETKYVADGDYLLNRVRVEVDGELEGLDVSGLRGRVRQRGNSRWFSALKIPLATYSLSGRDTSKWINRALRSIGEAPVIYDSLFTANTMRDLRMEMANAGYLGATVDVATRTKRKKIDVTYTLRPGTPHRLGGISHVIADTAAARLLNLGDTSRWLVRSGMQFNVSRLDDERRRMADILANQGYYKLNKEYFTYIADTMAGSKVIGLTMVMRPWRDSLGAIAPHPRYSVATATHRSGDASDSVIHLRPAVLHANTFIRPGQYYSNADLQKTYSHFGRLQAVKYTNISFREQPDSLLLHCDIQVSTNKPSTISFQPEGTNTAGDLGAAASLTYQNRNLFRGSEVLSVELRGAFEAIRGLEGYANDNFEEYSVETRLMFPRFIAPFLSRAFRRGITATSEVSMLYDLQNRPEYHRRVFSVAWRYKWANPARGDRYQIDLLDVNYVFMPWISETFRRDYLEDESSRNAILRYNYEDLLIMRLGLGYSYNNGRYAVKASVETAGNVLSLGVRMLGLNKNADGQYHVFNIAYAQYAKADVDLTRNIQFSYNNSLVFHLGFGIAYPYGNSTILPFEKRYFSGGANSVRGWSVRSLGPGSYKGRDGNIDFINQTGDMKLDANMEYRAHLFWKLGGALFVDAGNIWTLRNYSDQPGGQFSLKDFWQQIAVSYGLGLRLNFDFFILRFDFGMKAVNPAYNGRDRYPLLHPRLSRDLAFHFAVGLPF